MISAFPAITIEFATRLSDDPTLGDDRWDERYACVIRGFILHLDERENYLSLLRMDEAIKRKLHSIRVVDNYWRNASLTNSEYLLVTMNENICREVAVHWNIEQTIIPT